MSKNQNNMIYETIVTTVNLQGAPHVTPFGIRFQHELIVLSPYKPSTTLDNILATQAAVVNLTDDVRIFAGALVGKQSWQLRPADKVTGYRLADSLAHKELQLVRVEDDPIRPQLLMQIVSAAEHAAFQGFNRAQAAVIELAVLVSRLKRLPMDKIDQEMAYLKIAVEKTAGIREQEAWDWLVEAVENHRAMLNNENLA